MLHMIIPFAQAVGALFGMLGTQSYIDDIGPPMLPLGFIAFSAKGKFPLFCLGHSVRMRLGFCPAEPRN